MPNECFQPTQKNTWLDLTLGSRKAIHASIPLREEVESLGSKEGGLMMIYGLYPGVPIENIEALINAMENYSTFYS